ncbi:MAG: PepSY domain-containing protein [Thermonemataceae bacterium]
MEKTLVKSSNKTTGLRRRLYRWHRIIGIITVIPVIFWTLSGLMHPFMANWFKPTIPNTFLVPKPINKDQMSLSLREVLEKNRIEALKAFQLVAFEGKTYYQVKSAKDQLLYLDATTGKLLENGDKAYAIWLARYFLEDQTSAIKAITLQTDFDATYKSINRLLPVWKVDFARSDGMTIYVETASSRLGTYNPTSRKAFLWIFDIFHNWSFLGAITNNTIRVTFMIVLLGIIILSALSGLVIYGMLWKKFRKPKAGNRIGILRKYHRQIGLATALVTFTFAFSGAFHATRKYEPNHLPSYVYEPITETNTLPKQLPAIQGAPLLNMGLATIAGTPYFRLVQAKAEGKGSEVNYLHLQTGEVLPEGDLRYAVYLAEQFNQQIQEKTGEITVISSQNLVEKAVLTRFDEEYGFVFKRLPVVKLHYNTPQQTAYYVETSTARIAAKIENIDRAEGFSFGVFHKYSFMAWAGKDVRDLTTMLSALGVLVVSLFGLALFIKIK